MGISDLPIILKQIPKRGELLDVGCYSVKYGIRLPKKINNLGYNYHGVDKNYENLDLNITRCDIEIDHLPYLRDTFDIIILNQVLEHLGRNPVFALKEMSRVLKKGGVLVITTPNFFAFSNIKDLIFKGCSHDFYQLVNDFKNSRGYTSHIHVYTKNELKILLIYCGFIVERVFSYGFTSRLCGVAKK